MNDRLKRMFEESRLRHQNDNKKEEKPKVKNYKKKEKKKGLPPSIRHLLVKIEDARKAKIIEIEALGGVYKTKPCNDEPTPINRSQKQNIWHNPLIEPITRETALFLTREELQEAEKDPEETGRINWDVWDRLVDEFRKNNNIFPE